MVVKMKNNNCFFIRCNSRDFHTINEIFLENIYGEFMNKIKYDGGVIIDIGQNIGCFSVMASRIFKEAKIIGFEPFFDSYQITRTNIMINKLSDRIKAKDVAISAKNGTVSFYVYPGNYEANSIHNIWGGKSKKIEVNSIRLSDFITEEKIKNIDLLKVDCEGAEYEIIKSLSKGDYKKIKSIILEYHKGRSNEIEDVLKINKFKTYKIINSKETGIIFAKKF